MNNTLIGYELLMRKKTDQGWRPPANFSDVPSHVMADVLIDTTKLLSLKITFMIFLVLTLTTTFYMFPKKLIILLLNLLSNSF